MFLKNQLSWKLKTDLGIFIQTPVYSNITERACGGSRGLLLAIKASFDLRLPLGSASAFG